MPKVSKKDGSLEDFDRQKVLIGVQKAGGSPEEAQKVLNAIEDWLGNSPDDTTISSSEIRMKGLQTLKEVNPYVAASFESYQKPVEPK
jgi:transcriptional regulator NrdR family protein